MIIHYIILSYFKNEYVAVGHFQQLFMTPEL